MLILDTDHVSEFMRESGAGLRLAERLVANSPTFCVTIVSMEEIMRGRLAQLAKRKNIRDAIPIYLEIQNIFEQQEYWTIVPWSDAAVEHLGELQKLRPQIGTMDLRIAAIAIANKATLLSRNLRDFKRIPNLSVEDWLT
jgi:tRNA(fMet)-specific endonuclease VapC